MCERERKREREVKMGRVMQRNLRRCANKFQHISSPAVAKYSGASGAARYPRLCRVIPHYAEAPKTRLREKVLGLYAFFFHHYFSVTSFEPSTGASTERRRK